MTEGEIAALRAQAETVVRQVVVPLYPPDLPLWRMRPYERHQIQTWTAVLTIQFRAFEERYQSLVDQVTKDSVERERDLLRIRDELLEVKRNMTQRGPDIERLAYVVGQLPKVLLEHGGCDTCGLKDGDRYMNKDDFMELFGRRLQ